MATKIGKPTGTRSHPIMIEATPTCAPIARLNTPAESGRTSATAVMATIACVSKSEVQVRAARNVSGMV